MEAFARKIRQAYPADRAHLLLTPKFRQRERERERERERIQESQDFKDRTGRHLHIVHTSNTSNMYVSRLEDVAELAYPLDGTSLNFKALNTFLNSHYQFGVCSSSGVVSTDD